MIDLHCSAEVEAAIAYLASTGVPFKVTSTIRPGAITAAGNPSLHGQGLAVDFAGRTPTRDSKVLADIFHAFLPVEKHLAELIYAGPQVAFNIKNGARVGKYAQLGHHDHCHLGVRRGVLLDRLIPSFNPDSTIEQAPDDMDGREELSEPTSGLCAPNGGVWVLTRDGGVRAYKGAPFYGSYPGLKPEDRQGERTFVDIRPSGEGYVLISSGNEEYRFGP